MRIKPYIMMQKATHKINVSAEVLCVLQYIKHLICSCLYLFFYSSLFTILPNKQITKLANHNILRIYNNKPKIYFKKIGYI
jgi:hypothetical protein